MKHYFMQLFEVEEGEITLKEFLAAAGSLVVVAVMLLSPLYL